MNTQGKTTTGYYKVDLRNGYQKKKFRVHRLIALHFIPNPNNEKEVDHINRNILDNRIENLRWVNRE